MCPTCVSLRLKTHDMPSTRTRRHVTCTRKTHDITYSCTTLQHTATHRNTLQHIATHCNTLQHTATHRNTLQHIATHCNTSQHTATHRNTLQHLARHCSTHMISHMVSHTHVLMCCRCVADITSHTHDITYTYTTRGHTRVEHIKCHTHLQRMI